MAPLCGTHPLQMPLESQYRAPILTHPRRFLRLVLVCTLLGLVVGLAMGHTLKPLVPRRNAALFVLESMGVRLSEVVWKFGSVARRQEVGVSGWWLGHGAPLAPSRVAVTSSAASRRVWEWHNNWNPRPPPKPRLEKGTLVYIVLEELHRAQGPWGPVTASKLRDMSGHKVGPLTRYVPAPNTTTWGPRCDAIFCQFHG